MFIVVIMFTVVVVVAPAVVVIGAVGYMCTQEETKATQGAHHIKTIYDIRVSNDSMKGDIRSNQGIQNAQGVDLLRVGVYVWQRNNITKKSK